MKKSFKIPYIVLTFIISLIILVMNVYEVWFTCSSVFRYSYPPTSSMILMTILMGIRLLISSILAILAMIFSFKENNNLTRIFEISSIFILLIDFGKTFIASLSTHFYMYGYLFLIVVILQIAKQIFVVIVNKKEKKFFSFSIISKLMEIVLFIGAFLLTAWSVFLPTIPFDVNNNVSLTIMFVINIILQILTLAVLAFYSVISYKKSILAQ